MRTVRAAAACSCVALGCGLQGSGSHLESSGFPAYAIGGRSNTETLLSFKCPSGFAPGNEGFLHGGGRHVHLIPFVPDRAGLLRAASHALCR